MINLGILTSSRADFGIYEPLLRLFAEEKQINPKLIVFGTHLSARYGNSIQYIREHSIPIIAQFDTAPVKDTPSAIVSSMTNTMQSMADVWQTVPFDLLLALGDRYEMFAAVASSLPFNIKIAHIHGGETTLGAIDNALRHSITHMSSLHFTATETYRERVIELTGSEKCVFNTGALSIDNLSSITFLSTDEIRNKYNIDLSIPTILITLHPETIGFSKNEKYVKEVINALEPRTELQQIITMPNADTSGLIIRNLWNQYAEGKANVKLVENFGSLGYLSVMKYCKLMLGNTSSGFIEASWFPKWVINTGDRQKGRIRTDNIHDVPFDSVLINNAVTSALNNPVPSIPPIYGDGKASLKIIKHILDEFCAD